MERLWILTLTCLLSIGVYGQENWQDALRQWLTVEDMEEDYGEEAMEQLAERAAQPINLNQATREDLEALPFLSAVQVEELVAYLHPYTTF